MAQVNCFSFSPYGGIEEGIAIKEGVIGPSGKIIPNHVSVGGLFVQLNKFMPPETRQIHNVKRVWAAFVKEVITPQAEFDTLASAGEKGIVVHISTLVDNHHVREKQVVNDLNAWVGVVADSYVTTVVYNRGEGLFLLTENGQEVDVHLSSGEVVRLVRENGKIVRVHLDWIQMAKLRVEQLDGQLMFQTDDEEGVRRTHGILAGAVRFVRHTAKIREVREVFSSFLADNVERMTDKMRSEVRVLLAGLGDRHAGMFVSSENVISLDTRPQKASKTPARLEAERKRLQRIKNDRDARERMRGPSNGGGKKK